jgi:hypothetical protein
MVAVIIALFQLQRMRNHTVPGEPAVVEPDLELGNRTDTNLSFESDIQLGMNILIFSHPRF